MLVYHFSKLFIVNYFLNLKQMTAFGIDDSIYNLYLFRCWIILTQTMGKYESSLFSAKMILTCKRICIISLEDINILGFKTPDLQLR